MSEYDCLTCQFFEEQPSGDGLCNWAQQNLAPYWVSPLKFKVYSVELYEDSFVCPAWRKQGEQE